MTQLPPQEIIRKKRDNLPLQDDEIDFFVQGIVNHQVSPEQLSSFAMAIFFNGMSLDERTALTLSMSRSGKILQWDLDAPTLDKHSTGGVGDLVSLVLAPMVAACGGFVPMISGRGLGHTGGTLDKMDSIPGYVSTPDMELFHKTVKTCGAAIIGQSAELAPADRTFYAIRDVTATVESIDLITASILSKKISAGLDGLVMDVKVGSGAFMPSLEKSQMLAKSIISVANKAGLKTTALLTDMSQSLASSAGNALEVLEALSFLKNEKVNTRLKQVTLALCSQMLISGNLAKDVADAEQKLSKALSSGRALEIFTKMLTSLGGPSDLVERAGYYLTSAKVIKPVFSPSEGYVSSVNTRQLGMIVLNLGGGRRQVKDKIDYSVGLSSLAEIGSKIDSHSPIAFIHAKDEDSWKIAAKSLLNAVQISSEKKEVPPIFYPLT